jgi:uncharacterized membrane protein
VGSNAPNRPDDVRRVQSLLNRVLPGLGGTPSRLLVDGLCGGKTIGAISRFQKARLGYVDGRIDPGGRTFTALENEARGKADGRLVEARAILERMAVRCRRLNSEGMRPGDLGGPSLDADLAAAFRLMAGGGGTDPDVVGAAIEIPVLIFLIFLLLVLAMFAAMPRPRGAPRVRDDEAVRRLKELGEKVFNEGHVTNEEAREATIQAVEGMEVREAEWGDAMKKCLDANKLQPDKCMKEKTEAATLFREFASKVAFIRSMLEAGRLDVVNRELRLMTGLLRRLFIALSNLGTCMGCKELNL